MRRVISMVAGAACVAALALPVFAADMTIKGRVVCIPSPKEPAKLAQDGAPAMACAKQGLPVAVRTADAIYVVTGDYTAKANAKLLDFISTTVIATGEVSEKDGQKMMNVKTIKLVPTTAQ